MNTSAYFHIQVDTDDVEMLLDVLNAEREAMKQNAFIDAEPVIRMIDVYERRLKEGVMKIGWRFDEDGALIRADRWMTQTDRWFDDEMCYN